MPIEIKWWEKWLNADHLERLEMVEKLPFVREIKSLSEMDEKLAKHFTTTALNGFFEDMEDSMLAKMRDEKQLKP
jgi:hypothetical protein